MKRRSREYVDGGRKLLEYCHRSPSTANPFQQHIQEAAEAIDRFSNEVGEKLATLDQTIRDILQLVIIPLCPVPL